MELLFVTDLHYALKQYDWLVANAKRYAFIVIGGDLLDLGSALEIDVQIIVVEKYLRRIAAMTPLLVCSGNHDGDHRSAAGESIAGWLQDVRGLHLGVDGDAVTIPGALVSICPWWDGPETRAALEQQLERDAAMPKNHWIWVNHSPPQNTKVSWSGRRYAGDPYLTKWIEHYQPDLVLSGHVHNAPFFPDNGSWMDRLGKTWLFNPGRQIGPRPATLSLDLETGAVEWLSIEKRASLTIPALVDAAAHALEGSALI